MSEPRRPKLSALMRRRWVLLVLALAAAALPVGVAAGALGGQPAGSESAPEALEEEPRLDKLTAEDIGRERPEAPRRRGKEPTVVRALPPGNGGEASPAEDEGPPPEVVKENARLRRELDHLKALAAERRRVSRTLGLAGDAGPLRLGAGGLAWPINGPVTSPFGPRWGRLHAGMDIAAPDGTPIRAAESGRVVIAGWQGGYGNYTCIQHGGNLSTCYAHQSRLGTKKGRVVRQGQVMGFVGNTGNSFGAHVHFETWVGGQPVDPRRFL